MADPLHQKPGFVAEFSAVLLASDLLTPPAMEMFLTVFAVNLLVAGIAAVLLLATGRQLRGESLRADEPVTRIRSRFFADAVSTVTASGPGSVLLVQIERHVRLERAAAEAFCACPTVEGLQTPTMSPLRVGVEWR